MGNVTWKDDLKHTENNTSVCTFGLATNRNVKDADGEKHEEADYHSLVTFNKLAALAEQFIHKGRKVYVEGRLHSHKWTDNEGMQKAVTEIIVEDLVFLDAKTQEKHQEPAENNERQQVVTTV